MPSSLARWALLPIAVAACSAAPPDAIDGTAAAATPASSSVSTTQPASLPETPAMTTDNAAHVAFDRPQTRASGQLTVTSSDVQARAPIARHFTDYGDSVSPALDWTPVDGARAYALLLEDPDAKGPQPFVHWVAWNVPASVTHLDADVAKDAQPAQPQGMRQGLNGRQRVGYFGPRPPAGDPPHHYHFEVFALDAPLSLPDDAGRDALVTALASHVIAKGELVATAQAPQGAR